MSSTTSVQYNEVINDIRTAISSQDSSQIETLIKDLDAPQLRELLRSKYAEKTLLEYAFTAGSTTIGFFLLAKSQQKKLNELPFSWYNLFDLLEDFILARKKTKKITASRLASKCAFLSSYKSEIDVRSLIGRPKCFEAALALGAKFVPTHQSELIFDFVMKSKLLSHAKIDLIEWLLDHKFIAREAISIKAVSEIIQRDSFHIAEILLKHFPSLLEDQDDTGSNVMHYSMPNTIRFCMFLRALNFVSSHSTPEQLQRILTTKNHHGLYPSIFALKEGLAVVTRSLPETVLNSVAQLAREGRQEVLSELFNGRANYFRRNLFLKAYLIQCGMKMTKDQFTSEGDMSEISQLLWFVKPSRTESAETTKSVSPDNEGLSALSTLPNEILLLIATKLAPADFCRFSISSKFTMANLMNNERDTFWKEYYEQHFRPLGCNWQGLSYKTKFVQETKGLTNWRTKKFTSTIIKNFKPQHIDENWLILRYISLEARYSYWNCHTQQLIACDKKSIKPYVRSLGLHNVYSEGSLPPFFYTPLTYTQEDDRMMIRTGGNEDDVAPKNLNELLRGFTAKLTVDPLADNKVLISHKGLLYDVAVDKWLKTDEDMEDNSNSRCCVNPYNRTFIKKTSTGKLEVYNYQYELLSTISDLAQYPFNLMRAVDEYALFFQEQSPYTPSGCIDLRTGKVLWRRSHLIPNRWSYLDYAVSSTRLVIETQSPNLMASYHIQSQKFEWIHATAGLVIPIAVNNRYVASQCHGDTILFDFCADQH